MPDSTQPAALIVIGDRLFEQMVTDFYRADVPTTQALPSVKEPRFIWTGIKMPVATVHQILGFFRACYKDYRGEAMVRLAYHPEHGWKAVPMPQEGRAGMSVKDELDPEFIKALTDTGYQLFGSAHSHCNAAAFASGTDNDDEKASPGLHFTLGKITDSTVDLDVRVTMRGIKYAAPLLDWFDCPQLQALRNAGIPEAVLTEALKYFLLNPDVSALEYPERWNDRIRKPVDFHKSGRNALNDSGWDWDGWNRGFCKVNVVSRRDQDERFHGVCFNGQRTGHVWNPVTSQWEPASSPAPTNPPAVSPASPTPTAPTEPVNTEVKRDDVPPFQPAENPKVSADAAVVKDPSAEQAVTELFESCLTDDEQMAIVIHLLAEIIQTEAYAGYYYDVIDRAQSRIDDWLAAQQKQRPTIPLAKLKTQVIQTFLLKVNDYVAQDGFRTEDADDPWKSIHDRL